MNLTFFRSKFKFPLLLFPIIFLFTCIDRKNPWDPIHGCSEILIKEIRNERKNDFELHNKQALDTYKSITSFSTVLDSIRTINNSIYRIMDKQKSKTDSIIKINNRIDSINKQVDCKELENKRIIEINTLQTLSYMLTIDSLRNSIANEKLIVNSNIMKDNSQCFPHGVYTSEFCDSLMKHYDTLLDSSNIFINKSKLYNDSIINTNSSLTKYIEMNKLITQYNDSIYQVMIYCDKIWLSNIDQIKNKSLSIKAGDTLLIDSGTFNVEIRFKDKGDSTKPIIIEGSPFINTVLNPSNFGLDKSKNIIIRNITFSSGYRQNVTVRESRNITFDHCRFINSKDSSEGHGICIINSTIDIKNCIFADNSGNGIFCTDPNSYVNINNALIVNNNKNGILCSESRITIYKATISNNGIDADKNAGIHFVNQSTSALIVSTILTYNKNGFFRERSENESKNDFSSCVFYGNHENDFLSDPTKIVLENCFYSNPFYIDTAAQDYRIGSNSELYDKDLGYKPK